MDAVRKWRALAGNAEGRDIVDEFKLMGGQSIPAFDYYMAPYVHKTFVKAYIEAVSDYLTIKECFNYSKEDIKIFFERNKPEIRLDGSGKTPFSFCAECEKAHSYVMQKAHNYAMQKAREKTKEETYQAMEALVHNFNTLNSRAGSQVPFSSLNYGTDTSPEGRLVIKCLLKATQAGLGDGETPIFPVQIFKVKEGVNFNQDDPNYDLFKLAIETSSQRLFPNFSFLDAPFNKQYYTRHGDWNHEVAYMGCRTRVIGNPHDPTREVTCGRGNLSFTTINLPRLGIMAKGDEKGLFELLDQRIDLVIKELLFRLKIQGRRRVKNYPFLMGNGIWLDSEKLDWDDPIAEVLKHGTLTIGFIGLAECLKAFMGVHHGESEEAQALGLRLIKHMRERCDQQSKLDKLCWSLLATPAESLSGRFVPIDRRRFGVIEGVTDRDYYTNSFHVPVYFPIRAAEKIAIEAPYHVFTNGGHITYVELDGDTSKNLQAFEKIIRFMHDQGIGYGSINHPVDRDPVCGYTGVINDVCPRCGRHEGEAISPEKFAELKRRYNIPSH
ncbi:MAG: anaerobic ribonucleoside-triphosphate reductase [Desulfovibrio sp.]|nr:anaerobic ribonucleoside-triphosphate reductase [Desulfovibrio sp.]